MKKRWLILPVEIKIRELDAKLLLACHAALRGYGVIIGHIKKVNNLLHILPKGGYLDKSIAYKKTDHIKKCKKYGYYFTSIDEEASGCHARKRYQNERFSDKNIELTDTIFTWGDFERDVIIEGYPQAERKISNSGNHRIDLWGSDFHQLYKKEADGIKKKYGKYMFIPSNFSVSSNINGKEFLLRQAQNYGWFRNPKDREDFKGRIEHADKNFFKYLKLIPELAKHFPEKTIIIRPHPSEDDSFWKKVAKPLSNVYVISEGSATPYILGSACMIHHGCTTAFEAFLFGIPLIAYLPKYDERFDSWPGNTLSRKCTDFDDLVCQLKSVFNGMYKFPAGTEKEAVYNFANFGKWDACEHIIDLFDKVDLPTESINWKRSFLIKIISGLGMGYDLIKNIIRPIVLKLRVKSLLVLSEKYKKQKWPGTSPKEVNEILSAYASVNKDFSNINYRKIAKDIYCIYR